MAGSSEEQRVVLVKPGDMLLIGNARDAHEDREALARLGDWFQAAGIRVAVFANDIDLDLLPSGASDA
jgi:hypothetical protein